MDKVSEGYNHFILHKLYENQIKFYVSSSYNFRFLLESKRPKTYFYWSYENKKW